MSAGKPRRNLPVAFQGERGAFSEEAARRLLGAGARVLPCPRFEDMFRALQDGRAEGAVVPIENTLAGSVHENYDHLLQFEFPIVAETSVRIVHNLIAPRNVSYSKIKRVFSHPVALNQCLDFFARNPQIERIPFYDTAGSVKMLVEEGLTDAGAIASAVAAEVYGARILRKSLEDDRQNFTRFFLLRTPRYARRHHPPEDPRAQWKTSVVFSTRNVPGALFRALSALALRDLNLTKIESRPLRGKPWEYLFYVDFLGRADAPNSRHALEHLGELADFIRVLGCYPRGLKAGAVLDWWAGTPTVGEIDRMQTRTFWKTLGLAVALAGAAWSQGAAAPLGIFASHGDIGVTPQAGSTEFDAATGEYRITGGGANIWANVDAFQYVWKTLSGDLTLSADIQFIGAGANPHRKAVLMVRQDLTPGSAYADIALHGIGLTSLQYRLAAGAQTLEIQSPFNGSTSNGPVHVTLQRRGDNFTVSIGKPGGEMTSNGPQTAPLKDPVYVGIGVCSHDANILETAVFSNVKIVQP